MAVGVAGVEPTTSRFSVDNQQPPARASVDAQSSCGIGVKRSTIELHPHRCEGDRSLWARTRTLLITRRLLRLLSYRAIEKIFYQQIVPFFIAQQSFAPPRGLCIAYF